MEIDELTDVTKTAQLFIQGVTATVEMTKQLASMNSLCRTTTDKSVVRSWENTSLAQFEVEPPQDVLHITGGGKIVCGAELLGGQIYKACENVRCLKPMVYSLYYVSIGSSQKIFKSIVCL